MVLFWLRYFVNPTIIACPPPAANGFGILGLIINIFAILTSYNIAVNVPAID
jgi:hypothetical protein